VGIALKLYISPFFIQFFSKNEKISRVRVYLTRSCLPHAYAFGFPKDKSVFYLFGIHSLPRQYIHEPVFGDSDDNCKSSYDVRLVLVGLKLRPK
jgi:hypothetical protein